ncbi:DNA-binding SARP family transcriptional activator/DNA-binding XRE family transcriptional regulator/Tfp pilus assembly protein PilF [Allocatelliglobosispora scoriae]|uniref:DNA-binding SARP family transcriptional activator/DNA-binding XRE family transcriptional regulator/Tfp pilus assembly protein PilF n=1 Tax=Allocatelliglobosispora scoriae TaxID=643052 RepID=A0A841BL42_9ACTN|nr:BTAD domain-containing putative transcriptional regulator [Allocatelliglobosispora scoriae]MBB5867530.1 DNA-binding SARP family transcriptional activator/DNA-binding XRE family transcriptional regulator/Tfp pilus assembly protein PilF [Allocatelliglobosispora scoriae]
MHGEPNPPSDPGGLLRSHRHRVGLDQSALAERAGVSLRTLRDIEHGRVSKPRDTSLRRILTALPITDLDRAALHDAFAGHAARRPARDRPGLRLGVLGPLLLSHPDGPVAVDQAMPRTLLSLLALHPGQPVPVSEAIDTLWGDDPPKTCHNLVQVYVGRLRRLLQTGQRPPSAGDTIRFSAAGYLLDPAAVHTDVADFAVLCDQAAAAQAAGDPDTAADRYLDALRCWRGPVLGDFDPRLHHHPSAVRLNRRRIEAATAHADLALAADRPGETLGHLRELALLEPLHEGLHARLIRALAAAGEQAAALRAFTDLRERLLDQLGVLPGTQLTTAYHHVLTTSAPHAEPAAPQPRAGQAHPAQLPSRVAGFAGRTQHLAELDDLSRRTDETAAGTIAVVAGSAGVGKTALAVHWAHSAAPHFPDGQLYVNLRGFDPGGSPARPGEVLHGFLGALGVASTLIPAGDDGRAALYRTMLAGRRMLILLDNAADADQVRPLLPGSAGCFVLVTSRTQLTGLIVSMRAHLLTLSPLPEAEARQLLAARLSPDRLAAEADAIADLIDRCQRLPLALALVAARLAAQPATTIRALARQLDDADPSGSLDTLSVGDASTDLRTVFSWSYRHLGPDAARLFRLLGIHPGPDVSPSAVASLLAVTPSRARSLLRELTGNHLLQEQRPDRFEFHDLLRAYATELAEALDTPAARRQALHRVLDFYLVSAHTAAALLEPLRERLPIAASQLGVLPETLRTRMEALSWFAAERAALLAAVRRAEAEGWDTRCWQLAHIVSTCLYARGHWHDLASAQRTAMRAARRGGEHTGEGHAHLGLARVYSALGWWAKMQPHLRRALAIFADPGDHAGLARAHNAMALSYSRGGDHLRALHHNQHALKHFRLAGIANAYGQALNDIGWDYAQLGRYRPALAHCRRALRVIDALAEPTEAAHTWDSLGYIHHHLRDHRRAVACYEHAIRLFGENGNRYHEAETLTHLGDTYRAAGVPDAAGAAWRKARDILDDLHHPDNRRVHALLKRLDAGEPPREPALGRGTGRAAGSPDLSQVYAVQ